MRKQIIISTMAACAAVLTLSASAQNSPNATSGTLSDQSTSQSGSDTSRRYGGRMGQQETRASKIINAELKSTQGQTIGTVNDIILNPASGRVDFAVISANSSAANLSSTTSTTPSPSSTDTAASSSSLSSGKLVAVPWMLIRPAPAGGTAGASAAGINSALSAGQPTFTFAGDVTKLQSAPSFDQSNWPDITQYTWRQSVYSHFGMTPGSATGAATSPGGTESSSGSSSTLPSPSSPNDNAAPGTSK